MWYRRTQRLHAPIKPVEAQFWIGKPRAFPPIVDQPTFKCAQATLQRVRDSHWSDEKILKRIRRLLKAKGRLSEKLFQNARGMPSTGTIHKYFGTYQHLYERIGYSLEAHYVERTDRLLHSNLLRRALGNELEKLFPDHVDVKYSARGGRSMLRIDDAFMVSILFCGLEKTETGRCWMLRPVEAERNCITLLCLLSLRHDRVLRYYVAPSQGEWKCKRLYRSSSFWRNTVRLVQLSDFYASVKRVWGERPTSKASALC